MSRTWPISCPQIGSIQKRSDERFFLEASGRFGFTTLFAFSARMQREMRRIVSRLCILIDQLFTRFVA